MTATRIECSRLMTVEQLLALPDDGVDRNLIFGRIREKGTTLHGRRHARSTTAFSSALDLWLLRQPEPRGELLAGAGFVLSHNADTTADIDVAYISAETARANSDGVLLIDGVPVLAVEILSPFDSNGEISEKVATYLTVGVPVVWIADPVFKTLTVYQPGVEPVMFNATQYLDGGGHLPGLRVLVAELFV